MNVLLNMTTMRIVATSSQPKSVLCLSIIAEIKKVPDDYLIIGSKVEDINRSLSFDQQITLYQNETGDEIKKAMKDTLNYQLRRLIQNFNEDIRSASELEKILGRKFTVSKRPACENNVSTQTKEYKRPAQGTATGKVWDICDRVYNMQNPPKIPNKEQIIHLCVNEGINPSTAATQFGKWKASK